MCLILCAFYGRSLWCAARRTPILKARSPPVGGDRQAKPISGETLACASGESDHEAGVQHMTPRGISSIGARGRREEAAITVLIQAHAPWLLEAARAGLLRV